jgi:TolB-like protein/Tfp pilus assembly protein PilF
LDVARGSLRAADREIELRPKSFEVLRYLVERADRLVTKEELIKATWPNVAATDESLARCVSEVRNAIGDGQHCLIKTVPGRGYRFAAPVSPTGSDGAAPSRAPEAISPAEANSGAELARELLLPDRPSIAVLPFTNMSGDVEQEYFADGVVEEIITALSRFSSLFVIARNSSFTYKGRAVDVKRVGRELGVRYVLEGSVRKAAHQVRIAGQLIDAANGAHLWADRFDGPLADIFSLQDQITASVVTAIAPKLEQAGIDRAKRKPTANLNAYDCFLRGMASFHQYDRDATSEALHFFGRAIELDPDFAAAYGMAARCYNTRQANRWMTDPLRETAEAIRLARQAIELGRDDASALSNGGWVLDYVARDPEAGAAFIERACMLNPNLASAWCASGWVRVHLRDPDAAIANFAHAMRLSPLDHLMCSMQTGTAYAHFFAGRDDDALLWAECALREKPNWRPALIIAAASNALVGRLDRAGKIMARLRMLDPAFSIFNFNDFVPLARPEDLARFEEGFRKAGLLE